MDIPKHSSAAVYAARAQARERLWNSLNLWKKIRIFFFLHSIQEGEKILEERERERKVRLCEPFDSPIGADLAPLVVANVQRQYRFAIPCKFENG